MAHNMYCCQYRLSWTRGHRRLLRGQVRDEPLDFESDTAAGRFGFVEVALSTGAFERSRGLVHPTTETISGPLRLAPPQK